MQFSYSHDMQQRFPNRVTGILHTSGIQPNADVSEPLTQFWARAQARLLEQSEGSFPEIQAWRRAFKEMGLKPTQYRCASEALLRRFRKEGALPPLHPLIDLCNAASLAFAVPVAVMDMDHVEGDVTVRHADGSESYASFSGDVEVPDVGEVIFADGAGNAHARRWANRQSRLSAVSASTTRVLIVAEALHESAQTDVKHLLSELAAAIELTFGAHPHSALLDRIDAVFDTAKT